MTQLREQAKPKRPAKRAARKVEEAAATSWPLDKSERGDVLHRVRVFPEAVRDWREEIASTMDVPAGVDDPMAFARAIVDDGITRCREVERVLRASGGPVSSSSAGTDADGRRVLSRVQLFREARALPESTLPPLIADALPPLLRAHGATVCRPKPDCQSCEIRSFCAHFRSNSVAEAEASTAPLTIDLFAGAGGITEGFRRAGFRCLAASDFNAVAMKSFRVNHPGVRDENVIVEDVRNLKASRFKKLLGGRQLDVLIGAPPCQGFSSAGHRSKRTLTGYRTIQDERNYLFEDLIRLALELKPKLFLMENVPGMETARKENLSFLETAAKMLTAGGFKTAIWRMSASAHGVPQERARCFLVGSLKHPLPTLPMEEYQNVRRNDFDTDALPRISFTEATYDLPPRESGSGTGVDAWPRANLASDFRHRRYLGKFRLTNSSKLVWNHFVRYHNDRDLELYALLKQGEDSVHAIERHGRADLMRYRRDVFDDKYARLRADMPSKTIVAHLAKDGNGYIHPTQTRDISIREAARLQSFPDHYIFCGSPSDQWVQIGNAVPPVLAEAIAKSFRQTLKGGSK